MFREEVPATDIESEQSAYPAKEEVDFVLSALDAGQMGAVRERRGHVRLRYNVRAELRLFADAAIHPERVLYTRDVHEKGVGFITKDRLPLGYGGKVTLAAPDGRVCRVECTILRCQETVWGWYQGSLHFNRPQWDFSADAFE